MAKLRYNIEKVITINAEFHRLFLLLERKISSPPLTVRRALSGG